jgi:hypothetical protein
MYDNVEAKQKLVAALRQKQAVLVAGAGNSRSVGYPLWSGLVESLRLAFAGHLAWPSDMSPMAFASTIVGEIRKNKREEAYHNFLESTFQPPSAGSRQHDDSHVALVRLPFCGFTTTNYERVIESAIAEAFVIGGRPHFCEEVDLCDERPYRVFDFFRSLTAGHPRWVLHLHGYYRNPQRLILTEEDYLGKYGEFPAYDKDGRILNVTLDSLHRKVLWALCISHPLVFVGFSLDDGFFVHILRVLRQDLQLGEDLQHFAVMNYTTEDQMEQVAERLRPLNTRPVFYYVPPTAVSQQPDHSGRKRLIYELAAELGVSVIPESIASINKRMLEL